MKSFMIGVVSAVLILASGIANARCILQGTAVPISQVQNSLASLGYTTSNSVVMHHCFYRVTARDQSNQKWNLFFDPLTGNLVGKTP